MKKVQLILLIMYSLSNAQTPFSTPFFEPIKLEETKNDKDELIYKVADSQATGDEVVSPTKSSFFATNSLTLSILKQGGERYSASSQVIHYKLYLFTPTSDSYNRRQEQSQEDYEDRIKNYRTNIPLLLISKLSNSYDSINSSNSIDLLDYEAAPITIRTMPSFRIPIKDIKDRLLCGIYADLRALNLRNLQTVKNQMEIMASGGVGFTYEGSGEVGIYNKDGNYDKGNFSISVMLQGATGKKEIIQQLYRTEKDYVTSFQGYFAFNSLANNTLNLKIGYQYFFKETTVGDKFALGISLGM